MTQSQRELMHLAHDLYNVMLDWDAAELNEKPEDAQTEAMRARGLKKKLYELLKSEIE